MMKVVGNGQPANTRPVSNGILVNGHLYTVQTAADESGDVKDQTHQVLRQLETTLKNCGGTLADVAQMTICLINEEDAEPMDEVYREYFSEPYPNRATVVVKSLRGSNRLIEIVVNAYPGVMG